jgi:hypothetical protein
MWMKRSLYCPKCREPDKEESNPMLNATTAKNVDTTNRSARQKAAAKKAKGHDEEVLARTV